MKTELDRLEKTSERSGAPVFNGVLETSLYVDNLEKAEQFYGRILGLPKIFSVPGRQLVFRCGAGVLLIFDPKQTQGEQMTVNGGAIPLHGTQGAGHMALRIAKEQLGACREHLRSNSVAIESEISWPNGAHSIYFRDPAGNSLEFATPDIWGIS
jgi:catechol 2,3-dioxygenase-like lactoylglutathione lyase family enzyme